MKRFSEQLQKQADTIRLKAAERRELKERIVSYMEYHPLPASLAQAVVAKDTDFSNLRLVKINGWRMFQSVGAVLGILILSVTYLAEQTVPGDSLYAIKVSFNEEVRSTLAFSPYEKVVWETERLNRRISEARLLASEGKLTEAVEAEVANAVREHSENAQKEIEVLKQTNKEEAALASIQLATAIDVQSTSLRNNEQASTTEGQSTSQIATALAESEVQISELREDENDLITYERLTAQVEQETTRAYELLNNVHAVATAEEKSDTKRRLEDIERAIDAAFALSQTDHNAALEQLVEILERTQKLIVFMTNIDVRNTVTIEQIVPVTLTSEERLAFIKATAEKTLLLADKVLEVLASSSVDLSLQDKLEPAVTTSKVEVAKILELILLPEPEISILEERVKSAQDIVLDAATILQISPAGIVQEEVETEVEIAPVVIEPIDGTPTSSATSTEVSGSSTEPVVEDEISTDKVEPAV